MKTALKYPNIEAERARMGLSKTDIAEQLGVTRKTYYSWITTGNIPQTAIKKLVMFFGLSSEYLLGEAKPGPVSNRFITKPV